MFIVQFDFQHPEAGRSRRADFRASGLVSLDEVSEAACELLRHMPKGWKVGQVTVRPLFWIAVDVDRFPYIDELERCASAFADQIVTDAEDAA